MVDKLTDYIIRPTRRRYDEVKDLGPSLFTIDYIYYGSRIDFDIKNRKGKTLKCSLFHHNIYHNEKYPLMVYCHGNSGNRTYGYEIVYKMLRQRISVLTFDFAGCGNSEGDFISLGLHEQFDIEDVINYTLEKYNFIDTKKIGVWGRSMGAVSTLLFASRNHYISLIVLDSPFKDLSDLLKDYINRFKIVSSLMGKYLYTKIKKRALEKANFDIEELKPINAIATCRVPAFFMHTDKDKIVPINHSKALYEAYPADKEYLEMKGGHNSKRPIEAYQKINEFIKGVFEGGKKGSHGERECVQQKKDKAYYEKETDVKQGDCLVTKREKDEIELTTPRKMPDDLPNEKAEALLKEIAEMGDVNQQFLSVKESDEMGVSMISMTDDTTFRI